MNIVKDSGITYLYETYLDKINMPGTFDFQDFLKKLHQIEKITPYSHNARNKCVLCKHKEKTKLYTLNNIRWESILTHYIEDHGITPSSEFMDYIYRYEVGKKQQNRIKLIGKNKKGMLKIKKNQLLILDALMKHGGTKYYLDKENKSVFRYSEHAGLLHFDNAKLTKIIIFTNTNRIDDVDDDIYLPNNNEESFEYEYFFHTHPPTPKPGGRAPIGILYEFPSINDIFHYIDHVNDGNTKGSIILAAEGLYLIRKYDDSKKKIRIDEDRLLEEYGELLDMCQIKAIKKYSPFTTEKFYSVIAQDISYINSVSALLQKFNLWIDYYPRIKDNKGRWFVDTVYF